MTIVPNAQRHDEFEAALARSVRAVYIAAAHAEMLGYGGAAADLTGIHDHLMTMLFDSAEGTPSGRRRLRKGRLP